MKSRPLHCWDCGIQVIEGEPGRYTPSSLLRQVKFELTGGAYCESTFCVDCAEQGWDRARLDEFKSAVDTVSPGFRSYRIVKVTGAEPLTQPIAGIV